MVTKKFKKTLIIYTHPGGDGHSKRTLDEVKQLLHQKKILYDLIDLYALQYNPVLLPSEHYTSGGYDISVQNKQFQAMIAAADKLIFIYPVWWGLMPAMLKGFLDRVLTPHFAYQYEKLPFPLFGMKARPVGLLKGKKAAVFMSVGSPRWIHRIFTLNAQQFIMKFNILFFCGIRSRVFTLANADKNFSQSKDARIKRYVHKGIHWLLR